MIILDTNVLSELMRPTPEGRVLDWIAAQPATSLFTTTITQAEILYGLALLPAGRRKSRLERAADGTFQEDLGGRVLAFDGVAARMYAAVAAERRGAGRPISHFDGQIAAICRSRGAALATRNVTDFIGCGIELMDPWGP